MARRLGGTLAVVGALCALGPTVSSADAATTVFGDRDQRYGGDFLSVAGDDRANHIRVELDAGGEAFLVSDSRPIEIDNAFGNLCVHVLPNQARCDLYPHETNVVVDAGGGPDGVRFAHDLDGAEARGGGEDDTLIGGQGDDRIVGNKGKDVERGRRGSDVLGIQDPGAMGERDPGPDKLYGGRDDDILRADDRQRDKRLRCGQGHDVVTKDVALDPRPGGCEVINRRL
jgi:hypothetical protein